MELTNNKIVIKRDKELPSICLDIEVVKIINGYVVQFGKLSAMNNWPARNQWCYLKDAKNIPVVINMLYECALKCIEDNVPVYYDLEGELGDKIRKLKQ